MMRHANFAFVVNLALNGVALSEIASNNNVVVLVHGFMGWGPGEMFGFNYWGGVNSIAKEMQQGGHDVRVAVVGPVSSNWDRAAELYAYLKGGRVDYGAAHAERFHHSRYGRTFPGIFPEWGTKRVDGSLQRVHFVGHSMGGQTIRVLLRLLADGDRREQQRGSTSLLFQGGLASWVHSISTINTPHDGTTLDGNAVGNSFVTGVAWPLFKGICAIQGLFSDDLPYDFKLDQFGLERHHGEGFLSYSGRVMNSSIWASGFVDFSAHDLNRSGAQEINANTPAYSQVYYFSYASVDTHRTFFPFSKHQVPNLFMWEFLKPFSLLIGRTLDDTWWPNDGVVNTISQNGPKIGSTDVIKPWTSGNETFQPGVWNYMGARSGFDHLEMVGMGVQPVEAYYKTIATRLASLPDDEINSRMDPSVTIV